MVASARPTPQPGPAALRGIKWTTAVAVATAVLQVGYTSVMARLLDPGAFGLVALAGVVLRFGTYFAGLGLDRALVQRPTLNDTDVRASFTASLVTGVAVAAVFWALAPLAVLVLDDAAVVPLIRALALGFVVSAWGLPAQSLLRRAMRFETLAKVEISCYVLSYGCVGLGSAWLGAGVWSLVAANVSQQLFNSVADYAIVRHPLRPVRHWQPYRMLLGYGSQVSLLSFQEFIIGSLDTVLIGRQLGAGPLGFYNRAYMLVYLPMYFLTNSVGRVAFPAFSQVQHELPRLRELYQRSCTLVAALVLPLCAGVAVAAPQLVRVMLGPRWAPAGPVLAALCLAVPLAMLNSFGVILADVRANLRPKFWLNVQFGLLLLGLFWLLRGYGIVGVALATGLAELGRTVLYMRLTGHDLGLSYASQLQQYGPGLRNAAGVALAIGAVTAALRGLAWPPLLLFGAQLLAGAGALAALLLAWPLPELRPGLRALLIRAQSHPTLPAWCRPTLQRYAARLAPAGSELVSGEMASSYLSAVEAA